LPCRGRPVESRFGVPAAETDARGIPLLIDALAFAAHKHRDQRRKNVAASPTSTIRLRSRTFSSAKAASRSPGPLRGHPARHRRGHPDVARRNRARFGAEIARSSAK
jgi:hypothetical protein